MKTSHIHSSSISSHKTSTQLSTSYNSNQHNATPRFHSVDTSVSSSTPVIRHKYHTMPPFLPAMLYISDVRQPCIVRHPLHTGHHVTETASYYHIFHQRHTSVTSDKLAPSHIIYTQSLRHKDRIIQPHIPSASYISNVRQLCTVTRQFHSQYQSFCLKGHIGPHHIPIYSVNNRTSYFYHIGPSHVSFTVNIRHFVSKVTLDHIIPLYIPSTTEQVTFTT